MTSYRYIGYGVTDSNGVAHLDHDPQGNPINGYTGTGAGEVDVIASTDNPISSGSIVSEIYEVIDCTFYDEGLQAEGHHNDNWTNYGATVVRSDAETTVTQSTVGTNGFYQKAFDLTGFVIDFDYRTNVLDDVISLRKSTNTWWIQLSQYNIPINTWTHVNMTVNETSLTITIGSITREYAINDIPTNIVFRLRENEEIKYKNFKIYQI